MPTITVTTFFRKRADTLNRSIFRRVCIYFSYGPLGGTKGFRSHSSPRFEPRHRLHIFHILYLKPPVQFFLWSPYKISQIEKFEFQHKLCSCTKEQFFRNIKINSVLSIFWAIRAAPTLAILGLFKFPQKCMQKTPLSISRSSKQRAVETPLDNRAISQQRWF